jgi:hypothetical protein
VKAFNTTFAGTLVDGEVAGQQLDVLIAGDDPAGMTDPDVGIGGPRPRWGASQPGRSSP